MAHMVSGQLDGILPINFKAVADARLPYTRDAGCGLQGAVLLRQHGAVTGRAEMTAKRTLIRGGQVYDHDGDVHKPARGRHPDRRRHHRRGWRRHRGRCRREIIDASRRLVVPGLINAHYHSHDMLCRGMFEELPLEFWLLYTLPMGANRSKEEVRARTLVGALESSARRHHHGAGHARPGAARRWSRPTS